MNRCIFSSTYCNPDRPSCLVHLMHCFILFSIFHCVLLFYLHSSCIEQAHRHWMKFSLLMYERQSGYIFHFYSSNVKSFWLHERWGRGGELSEGWHLSQMILLFNEGFPCYKNWIYISHTMETWMQIRN